VSSAALAFDLQGHRGARALAPENTLPGFARALGVGVSTLELDVGMTRDGVVVVAHDRRLNPDIARGADGRWLRPPTPAIRDLTLHELQRYDVGRIRPGSEYSNRFRDQKRMDGVRIPTLESVFDLVRHAGNDAVRFNIEVKVSPEAPQETAGVEELTRALVKVIRDNGVERRATIQSFDWRVQALVRKEAPEIAVSYLTSQQQWGDNVMAGHATDSPWTADVQWREHRSVPKMVAAAAGGPGSGVTWSPYFGELSEAQVREAKALGLKVLPWTVNERGDMDRLIEWGVDGIITDYPDRLREVMQGRGLTLPAPTPVAP
jgi:glycerophosphoryl diester phosphodiesterase